VTGRLFKRAAALNDLVEHDVYLAENGGDALAEYRLRYTTLEQWLRDSFCSIPRFDN
jgi:hypothetical protein